MRYLLDTHIAIWAVREPGRLAPRALAILRDPDTVAILSAVVLWEIAIKQALPKRRLTDPMTAGEAAQLFHDAGFASLPVTGQHGLQVATLPPIHGDPFDRMMVAQAQVEGLKLLTADAILGEYGDAVIVV